MWTNIKLIVLAILAALSIFAMMLAQERAEETSPLPRSPTPGVSVESAASATASPAFTSALLLNWRTLS